MVSIGREAWVRVALFAAVFALAGVRPMATDGPLVADTFVNEAQPSSNFGTLANLNVGDGSYALLRFSLSTLPDGTSPTLVSKATLRLWVNTVNTPGALDVKQVMVAWREGAVTWNTAPVLGPAVAANVRVTAANQYVTIDVTDLVRSWLSGTPNYGLAVATASMAPSTVVFLDSKENTGTARDPKLDITLVDTVGASRVTNASTAEVGFTGVLEGDVTGPQSATVVSMVGGVLASDVAAVASLVNAATEVDTAGTIVKRNASGNFAAGTITANGNVTLAESTSVNVGNIFKNTTPFMHNFGVNNTFLGENAGNFGMVGDSNTATGALALSVNTTGAANTAIGNRALSSNTSGTGNIGIGDSAGSNLTTGANNIAIGHPGVAGESNMIRIGSNQTDTFLTGVVHGDGSGLLELQAAARFTGALVGDVTGTQSATTVSTVGGVTAAVVAAGATLSTGATEANAAGSLVKRDLSGNFEAGIITATLAGNANTATSSTSFTGALVGDVTGTQNATIVSAVGGVPASGIATAASLANAATDTDTAGTIVRRDANGDFAAATIGANGNVTLPESTSSSVGNIFKAD